MNTTDTTDTRPAILMLTPYLPYPPVSGGRTRTYNLLRRLSTEFNFTLVCFGRPDERAFDLTPLREFCELFVIERAASPGTIKAALLSLTSLKPITMTLYRTPEMRACLADLIATRTFAAVHVESFYMAQNLPDALAIPVLLCEPSIEYKAWGRFARVAKPFYQRPAVALESLKMRAFEPRAWRAVDCVGVMSDFDRALVNSVAPGVTVVETPNGVDTDFFTNQGQARQPNTALYMGDYKYFPNTEAVDYFMREMMPLIRAQCPDFTLTLLGKDAPPAFLALSDDPTSGLKVAGLVDDTRPYLGRSAVFVCPQRSGGGTRFKLLESMASGCPVVSTTLGAEGLEAVHERDLLIADTPRAFAESVLRVLADPALANRLGSAGRDLILSRHSWERSADRVRSVYLDLIG